MGQLSFPSGMEPIPGYRFIVFLDGILMGFRKFSGIVREVETETYQEGGLNTSVHVFPKACTAEHIITLEKGTYGGIQHSFSRVGQRLDGVLNLVIMDNLGLPLKSYVLTGLIIKKWEIGELSAENNDIVIDRFEISYEDFQVVI